MPAAEQIMPTASQIRGARGMLRWSKGELARRAGVSVPTLERAERGPGVRHIGVRSLEKIRQALEAAGVEFIAPGD
jgi:transcriptional regulator with XRE-family HTH domain